MGPLVVMAFLPSIIVIVVTTVCAQWVFTGTEPIVSVPLGFLVSGIVVFTVGWLQGRRMGTGMF